MLLQKIKAKAKWWGKDVLWHAGFKPTLNKRPGELQVIVFHGVCSDEMPPINARFIRQSHFEHILDRIAATYTILSLEEALAGKRDPDKLNVLITFDDGYRNNLTRVLPVCEARRIPFTVFVTARTKRILWPDAIDVLDARGEDVQFLSTIVPTLKDKKTKQMKLYITRLKPDETDRITDALIAQLGEVLAPWTEFCELLSDNDVKELGTHPLVNIGNHSANHYSLAELNQEQLFGEMEAVNQRIERLTGQQTKIMAYPFGHYTEATVRTLQKSGFTYQFISDGMLTVPKECTDRLMINPYISINNLLSAIDHGHY